jgi:hypothetical protein
VAVAIQPPSLSIYPTFEQWAMALSNNGDDKRRSTDRCADAHSTRLPTVGAPTSYRSHLCPIVVFREPDRPIGARRTHLPQGGNDPFGRSAAVRNGQSGGMFRRTMASWAGQRKAQPR